MAKDKSINNIKHYIKLFFTDDIDGGVLNCDGLFTTVAANKEELEKKIGFDVYGEIKEDLDQSEESIYGYKIEYSIKPITTDPYK